MFLFSSNYFLREMTSVWEPPGAPQHLEEEQWGGVGGDLERKHGDVRSDKANEKSISRKREQEALLCAPEKSSKLKVQDHPLDLAIMKSLMTLMKGTSVECWGQKPKWID